MPKLATIKVSGQNRNNVVLNIPCKTAAATTPNPYLKNPSMVFTLKPSDRVVADYMLFLVVIPILMTVIDECLPY